MQTRPLMVAEPGVRFGIANGLIVAVLYVGGVLHLTGVETEFLTVLFAGLARCGLPRLLTAGVGVAAERRCAVPFARRNHVPAPADRCRASPNLLANECGIRRDAANHLRLIATL